MSDPSVELANWRFRARWPKRLAVTAYVLSCLGPACLVVLSATNPPNGYGYPDPRWQGITLAIAALSPAGAAMGLVAAWAISRYHMPKTNYAQTAVALGISNVLALVIATTLINAFFYAPFAARGASCISNLKQIAQAASLYGEDYDGRMPGPRTWNQGLEAYMKNEQILHCPSERDQQAPSYALNRAVAGRRAADFANRDRIPFYFDSIRGRNLSGGMELLPEPARHKHRHGIGFLDGHARLIAPGGAPSLVWRPAFGKASGDGKR